MHSPPHPRALPQVRGPYLVVAPLSTLSNWRREFERWAPDIPVILYHGTPDERAELRPQIMTQDSKLKGFTTVITSYEIVMRDRRHLAVSSMDGVVGLVVKGVAACCCLGQHHR